MMKEKETTLKYLFLIMGCVLLISNVLYKIIESLREWNFERKYAAGLIDDNIDADTMDRLEANSEMDFLEPMPSPSYDTSNNVIAFPKIV